MLNTKESQAPTKTEQLVFIENNKPKTTSRLIAKTFGKQHRHVLRDIEKLTCSEKFTQSNFGLSYYKDRSGKENKEFHLTKDGFTMLAFGYIGEKAMKFKEDYIERFNLMEQKLQEGNANIRKLPEKASYVENVIYPCKLGDGMVHCYNKNNTVYVRLSTLFTFLGSRTGGVQGYVREKLGEENLIQVPHGKILLWFGNYEAFKQYLKYYTPTSFKKINAAARDIWGIDYSSNPDDPYVYHFTSLQILEIFELIFESPINKNKVIQKLGHGKMEGGY